MTTMLSVTEAKTVAAVECMQDMLFGMHLLESMGLKVKKPMVLEIDNKGAKDLPYFSHSCTPRIPVPPTFQFEVQLCTQISMCCHS
jgi:hypothetical protein